MLEINLTNKTVVFEGKTISDPQLIGLTVLDALDGLCKVKISDN